MAILERILLLPCAAKKDLGKIPNDLLFSFFEEEVVHLCDDLWVLVVVLEIETIDVLS